jgi:hypothetical protein
MEERVEMKNLTICLMGVLLLLGLSSDAMAIADPADDQFVAGKDMIAADALFYPPSSAPVLDKVKLTVTMNGGSTFPAMINWDFDADNNPNTGSGTLLSINRPPCPTADGGCKQIEGIDFSITLMLRDQSDTAATSYCASCIGGGNCLTRGDLIACNEPNCYVGIDKCSQGDPNCWVVPTDSCTGIQGCESSYQLIEPCDDDSRCDSGLQYGEFFVGSGSGANTDPIYRGRVYDIDSLVDIVSEYSFILPWGEIVAQASIAHAVDYNDVVDNPPYQVSIWYDDEFDGDDLFDQGLLLNVTDYLPNSETLAASSVGAELCTANTNPDVDCEVGITDLIAMKQQYFRSDCPNCK